MCGIAGHSLLPGVTPSPDWLSTARAALRHRGPDDSGVFEDQLHGIGLIHTRLSILDPTPLGHQPMLSSDGRVALVFNGEIYNFRALRAELESLGHCFRGESDTEVLLNLYLEHRHSGSRTIADLAALLRRLNGMFAFALWDTDRQGLLLARDALGVKPLYYQPSASGLHFASEIKALPPTALTLDPAALDRYLSFLWCPGDGTPAAEVRKLGPGEAMWVAQGTIQEHATWYRLPAFALSRPSPLSRQDAIRGTGTLLRQAVHRQMVADVPVGAFLSGGLDSSSVVAFARELNPEIQCFTIEATGPEEEGMAHDLPYAWRVAQHLHLPLEVVRIDADRMAADLPAMVAQLDEPLADPAPLNVLYISRLAREHGIKVLLSGAGGDDLFTGYRRHRALISEGLWSWLPQPARAGLERFSRGLDQRRPLLRRLAKLFNAASQDADARLVHYFRWADRRDLQQLYAPSFRAALGEVRAQDQMLDFLAHLPSSTHRLERMLALEQRFFLTDHNLTYTDKMSMAAGVEVRVPFLDLDLVAFAARIPPQFKQHGAEGKWVLKQAMQPYLPRDVIHRPKTGFGAPLRRWMRFELRDLLADVLGERSLRHRGLFDPSAVQRLIAANDQGRLDASYTLFSLVCIELWCRRFIDRGAEATPTPLSAAAGF